MGSKGGEEGGNAPGFGATVQARACRQARPALLPCATPVSSPFNTHRGMNVPFLV